MKGIFWNQPFKSLLLIVGAVSSLLSMNSSASVHKKPLEQPSQREPLPFSTQLSANSVNAFDQWEYFPSHSGQCKMRFPSAPDHLSERLRLEDSCELSYDAYIVAAEPKTVYMLLIARYPAEMSSAHARASLEGFLNGVLTHNPNNQLLCADLLLVEGNEALDFFIRSGAVYFRGRAILAGNSLYLMAIECEVQHYDDSYYNAFVNSFKLQ